MHCIVARYGQRYMHARKHKKQQLVEEVVALVKKSGGVLARFLKRVGRENYWVEVTDDTVCDKVSHGLRCFVRKQTATATATATEEEQQQQQVSEEAERSEQDMMTDQPTGSTHHRSITPPAPPSASVLSSSRGETSFKVVSPPPAPTQSQASALLASAMVAAGVAATPGISALLGHGQASSSPSVAAGLGASLQASNSTGKAATEQEQLWAARLLGLGCSVGNGGSSAFTPLSSVSQQQQPPQQQVPQALQAQMALSRITNAQLIDFLARERLAREQQQKQQQGQYLMVQELVKKALQQAAEDNKKQQQEQQLLSQLQQQQQQKQQDASKLTLALLAVAAGGGNGTRVLL
jgi:hypothetical protein